MRMTVTLVRLSDQCFFVASRDVPLGCHLARTSWPAAHGQHAGLGVRPGAPARLGLPAQSFLPGSCAVLDSGGMRPFGLA